MSGVAHAALAPEAPPTARLAAYGVFGLPLAMAALPVYVHVPKFYVESVGLSLATVGAILLGARLLDALQDPLLGWWSDRRRARTGSRRAFIGGGAVLLAAGMLALFDPPAGGATLHGAWLVASLAVVYAAYSMASVSYQACGAEISADPVQRTRVAAWREGFGLAGVMAAAVLPGALAAGEGAPAGYLRFAILFAPLVLLAALAAMYLGPGLPPRPAAPPPSPRRMLLPLANPRFRWLLAVFLVSGTAAAIPATLVLFFVDDVIRRPDLSGAFLATYFGAGAAGLPLWTALSRRVGKARAWTVGMACSVVAFVGAFLLGAGDAVPFFAICALSGLALGADLSLPPSMLADAIDHDGDDARGRHEGAYFGVWNLVAKLALALAAGLALPLVEAAGYVAAGPNGARELAMLAAVYALVPSLLKVAAAGLLWCSPLTEGERR